ncbi:MAG: transpeptidase family protein [Bacteroidales bacterium]|nr:transpeptidase family protein [Candidatus Sodaliphilus limicaballi]
MKKNTTNKRNFISRYRFFVGAMLLFASCIVFKMFKTTVVYASEWNDKANKVLTRVDSIAPVRGKIYADNGMVLATNMQLYTARIDWKATGIKPDTLQKYLPALCDSLAAFDKDKTHTAEYWQTELLTFYKNSKEKDGKRFYRLMRGLTGHEFSRLASFPYFNKGSNKSGLISDREIKRTKPFGAMASRSIGGMKQDSTGNWHGSSGLEYALDSLLFGKKGVSKKVQLTNKIVSTPDEPAIPGYNITTTINVDMQDILENELYDMCKLASAKWATAILMEVATGEIKAISNLTLDDKTGDYVEGTNNAVIGYEPGSVIKPISMMVALEDGVVTGPDHVWTTGAVWTYAGKTIKDPHSAPTLTAEQIIARSSNVGMSKIIASKYGNNPDGFRQRLEQMGFFEPFNSGIGGERVPVFNKLGNTNADRVALTRMAFGYTTLVPPLRTLAMYNAIANDGKFVRPHLVKKLSREGEPDSIVPITYIREQVCSPKSAQSLRQMLHAVVWDDHGTAHRYLQDDKVEIAGKTGTAFVTGPGGYSSSVKRYAFCGFFPYSAPKYSCMVLMMGSTMSAAASSGVVLKNTALKMYARGMLGNESKYEIEVDAKDNPKKAPQASALLYSDGANVVKNKLGITKSKTLREPSQPKSGVPNVVGKSLREALDLLEKKGLNVQFAGTGYVVRQSVAAGSAYKRGDLVTLALKQ